MAGIKRFQERMRAIPKEVRKATEPSLVKSAEEIAALQRQLAPEAEGDLAASIEVTGPGEQTPPYSMDGGSYTVPENAAAVTAGNAEVRYPHLQEYGTSHHPAQPYFWPGYRSLKTRATRRIKRAMTKAVKENWGK